MISYDKISPKGRTKLILSVSRAKNHEEHHCESVFCRNIPKPNEILDFYRFLLLFSRFPQFSCFFQFFELQASYGAENLTTERSRCPRFFVLCMGAPAWPKHFEKTSRESFFPIFFATDDTPNFRSVVISGGWRCSGRPPQQPTVP